MLFILLGVEFESTSERSLGIQPSLDCGVSMTVATKIPARRVANLTLNTFIEQLVDVGETKNVIVHQSETKSLQSFFETTAVMIEISVIDNGNTMETEPNVFGIELLNLH
jgi:hypothetical protein